MSTYRIFGSELSPYSVKVRSYFRYKNLPHEWIPRSPAVQAEFRKYAKLPLVPLVVTPEGEGIQDSTPIIERFEAQQPAPSIVPDDPALAFISALIEDFGLWGQFYEAATDPPPGAIMRTSAPKVMAWVQRMLSPKAEGTFESWSALAPTLMPLLREEVGGLFLPWSTANAEAVARGAKSFETTLGSAAWAQEP